MSQIRVLVVDDHTLIRKGIVGLLEGQPDITVIGEASSGQEGLDAALALEPDVVLMDIAMPGISGLEATRSLRSQRPETQVLILTIHDREDYLFEALRAGAAGYVLKGADVQDLLAAVRSAHRGQVYLYPTVAKTLVADYLQRARSGSGEERDDRLSDREREVLNLIAQGKTSAQIADALFLSPHTVQSHRDHIMSKLDLHSKGDLIKYAIAKGLIDV